MNIETINKWLDEEYGCSYTRLEELHDFYFEKYCDLKQENQKLKIQISAREEEYRKSEELLNTILNFEFFKNECPLNLGFEKGTNEDKAQDVFYEDEYCENNCNDDYRKCWLKYFEKMQELERDGKNE